MLDLDDLGLKANAFALERQNLCGFASSCKEDNRWRDYPHRDS